MSNALSPSAIEEFARALRGNGADDASFPPADERFAVDGVTAEAVIAPADEEQVARVLAEARESALAVIPVGGGQHLQTGNLPEAYDVAVSLERLRGIVVHEPADMTVTVRAGERLAGLQARLAEHGQHLPLDPPCAETATVGGVLSANAHGPLRHAHGTARDWLIGIRVAGADGAVSKSGGRVVKNVTGYDMGKLYVGALGTLGVITEATFKLAPLPAIDTTVAASFDAASRAASFIADAHDRGLALTAAELLSPPAAHAVLGMSRWNVVARLGGGAAAVERTLRELRVLSHVAGGVLDVREHADVWPAWYREFAPADLTLRMSVLPSRVGETVEVLDRRFVGAAPLLSSTVTAGVIRARLDTSRIRALTLLDHAREIVGRRGGFVVVEAAPPTLKRQVDVFGELRADIAIMRRLKQELDPRRTLAPGRFAGRI